MNGTSGLIIRASPLDPAVDKRGVHAVKTRTVGLSLEQGLNQNAATID